MKRSLLWVVIAGCLVGCAQLGQPSLSAAQKAEASQPKLAPEQMYQYMLVELMAERGEYAGAYQLLSPLVEKLRDPTLAKRLFALSMQTYDLSKIEHAAMLWHDIEPQNPTPLRALWLLALRQGKIDQAVKLFDKYQQVTKAPLTEDLRLAVERMAGAVKLEKALAFLQRLQAHYGDRWEVPYGLGILYLEKNQSLKALDAFNHALERGGDKGVIYPYMAQAYLQAHQIQTGINRLKAYVEAHPENWQLQAEYGRLQIEQGDLQGAAARFRQVLKIEPNADVARLALGLLLFEQGKRTEAKQHFEKLLKNPVTASVAHYYLGRIAESFGQLEEAMVHYLQVRHPKYQLDAFSRLVQIVYRQRGLNEALKLLDALKADQPKAQNWLLLLRASLYQRAGKKAEALRIARQLETRMQDNPDGLMQLANLYYALEAGEDYERVLRRVLTLAPENADALNALGYYFVEQNRNLDEAKQLLEKAIALKPDAFYIQDSMGWLYYRMGDLAQAETWLRKALAGQEDEEVLAHLMQVLADKGDEAGLRALKKKYAKLFEASEILRHLWRKIHHEMSRPHGGKGR